MTINNKIYETINVEENKDKKRLFPNKQKPSTPSNIRLLNNRKNIKESEINKNSRYLNNMNIWSNNTNKKGNVKSISCSKIISNGYKKGNNKINLKTSYKTSKQRYNKYLLKTENNSFFGIFPMKKVKKDTKSNKIKKRNITSNSFLTERKKINSKSFIIKIS